MKHKPEHMLKRKHAHYTSVLVIKDLSCKKSICLLYSSISYHLGSQFAHRLFKTYLLGFQWQFSTYRLQGTYSLPYIGL